MLGADLIGFHTYGYVRHFLSSVRRILGYEHSFGEVRTGTRVVRTDLFPMGIDYRRFADAAGSNPVQGEIARIRQKYGKRKIILSFDRLDYTKGIPLRLEAFDTLLEKKPEYQGKISLVLVAVPSRAGVGRYQVLKKMYSQALGRMEDLRQQFQGPNTLSATDREKWKKTMHTIDILNQILYDTQY